MSTTLLFAVCAALVFAPLVIEVLRVLGRAGNGVTRAARARSEPTEWSLPPAGSDVEESVREQLYSRDPRSRRLEVEPAAARPARAQPRWPLTGMRRPLRVIKRTIGREPELEEVQAEGKDDVRAA